MPDPLPPTPTAINRSRGGLTLKMGLVIGVPAVVIIAVLNVVFAVQTNGLVQAAESKRALAVTREIAVSLSARIPLDEEEAVQASVAATRAQMDDLAYVLVRGAEGSLLGASYAPGFEKLDVPAPAQARDAVGQITTVAGSRVLPVTAPLFTEESTKVAPPRLVGTIQAGFKLDAVDSDIIASGVTALGIDAVVLLASLLIAFVMARRLVSRIKLMATAAASIAAGDLAQRLEQTGGQDELGDLARSFDGMSGALRGLVKDLQSASSEVEREAVSIVTTSTEQSAMASQQASAINETSSTVTEIAQTSKQATEQADSVIKLAQRSEELSREGMRVVDESMNGMDKLGEQMRAISLAITELRERTQQISEIIATVKDLAEQSNLLALNAAIEAAKAGEQGRGFAVVALEMRDLAEQSKAAASQVRAILSEVQKGTRAAVAATEEGSRRTQAAIALAQGAGASIVGLADVIRDSSTAARQIATNTRQQTIGVEQIVSAISELSGAMGDALEGTRRIETVASNLNTVSKRLSDIVGRYQA